MALRKYHKPSTHNTHTVSQVKARKILRDGSVHGKKLTPPQRRFFGARAGGTPVRRVR